MLSTLSIEKTRNTPQILLDAENQKFEIKGRSIPEDALKFYLPVLQWIEKYVEEPNETTVVEIDLEYFNSSSAKRLMKFLSILEKLLDHGKNIKVIWKYQEGDELLEERGQELQETLRYAFELQPYK